MKPDRIAIIVIYLGIALSLLSGVAVVWASTYDNPDFAEPLIWIFAGSVAVTKVAWLCFRSSAVAEEKIGKVTEVTAAMGALSLAAGEADR